MRFTICILILLATVDNLQAARLVTLTAKNWDTYAPRGKEADCIYGDFVLQNDRITAVIANPVPGRNANVRTREVGGSVIDLTVNNQQSDQLTAFFPAAGRYALQFERANSNSDGDASAVDRESAAIQLQGKSVQLRCRSIPADGLPSLVVTYRLKDGDPSLTVDSTFRNEVNSPLEVDLVDRIIADQTFEYGHEMETNLAWWYDPWFGQAYGIVADQRKVDQKSPERKVGSLVRYTSHGTSTVVIEPGKSYQLLRNIFPGNNLIEVRAVANQMAKITNHAMAITVVDPDGPVAAAQITIHQAEQRYAWGRTRKDGSLPLNLPAGMYSLTVESIPRGKQTLALNPEKSQEISVTLARAGYVEGRINDENGQPVACKVQFRGTAGTSDPDFGPDSGEHAVKNLYYTADGRFRHQISPGTYDTIISHGPEYDVVYERIKVRRGHTTTLTATLARTVDTSGWISADFHSHSSPSGDNTSSQYGRVLNLLAEHIEFAPCTEHNRISSYTPHLQRLAAEHRMATCVGMELTGSLGSVNHQNAFPLVYKPRTQDGGGPRTHEAPLVQIERLALWDDGSEKIVQGNHPNIVQILGDRDLDGQADSGFQEMFGFMDVIEVNPPDEIFNPADSLGTNSIFHWLQLLNLGYRIPGVVNTDAHYNFHGSGWLRNYLKCPTDDPAQIRTMDIVHAAERGNLILTNGPYLEIDLTADGRTVTAGDEIRTSHHEVSLHVRVQCPNWIDIDRVQIFINGRPQEDYNFRRRVSPEMFNTSPVRFDQKITLHLKEDTHVVVATIGEQSTLGPVMGPDHEQDRPVAVSNPIFVDVNGDGFSPNGDLLGVKVPKLP